jgi:Neuraminidase (sialidase)
MTRSSVLVVLGAVLVMGTSTVASASFFDVFGELPAPQYREKKEEVVLYANGSMARNMRFLNVTGREAAPADGVDNDCDSFFDIFIEVSTDGGGNWEPMTGHGQAAWRFHGGPSVDGVQSFEAEILSMSASILGGGGADGTMIRESPTRSSNGSSDVGGGGGGGYMIDSFFDIFTEVSMDGGQTWSESNQSARINGLPEPATLSLLALGGLALIRRRK